MTLEVRIPRQSFAPQTVRVRSRASSEHNQCRCQVALKTPGCGGKLRWAEQRVGVRGLALEPGSYSLDLSRLCLGVFTYAPLGSLGPSQVEVMFLYIAGLWQQSPTVAPGSSSRRIATLKSGYASCHRLRKSEGFGTSRYLAR